MMLSEFEITPELRSTYETFPTWLRENSVKPIHWVVQYSTTHPGKFIASTANGAEYIDDTVYEVYRHIAEHERNGVVVFDRSLYEDGTVRGMVFDDSVEDDDTTVNDTVDEDAEEDINDFLATPEAQYQDQFKHELSMVFPGDSSYVMMTSSYVGWIRGVQEDFERFAKIRETYLQNADDFEASFDFVHEHPMGWVKSEISRGVTIWQPNGDLRLEPHFLTAADGTKYVGWELEYGEHADPEYTHRYLDTDLSVYDAASPEAAYVQLAANIEAQYYPNGVEKQKDTEESND